MDGQEKNTPTLHITCRIIGEYKILMIEEAMRQNMGISQYVAYVLSKHCVELIKRGNYKQLEMGWKTPEKKVSVSKLKSPPAETVKVVQEPPQKIVEITEQDKRDFWEVGFPDATLKSIQKIDKKATGREKIKNRRVWYKWSLVFQGWKWDDMDKMNEEVNRMLPYDK